MRVSALTIIKKHFTQNAQQHAISCLHLSIALGVIRRGSAVLDPIMFQDLSNILVDKKGAIIANDFMRYAKPCDNVIPNEISHGRTGCLAKGNGLNPL